MKTQKELKEKENKTRDKMIHINLKYSLYFYFMKYNN